MRDGGCVKSYPLAWLPVLPTRTAPLCRCIYAAIIEGHLGQGGFAAGVAKLGSRLVDATLDLHRAVMNNFLPSALKFHYQFNLRELSAITQVRASQLGLPAGGRTTSGLTAPLAHAHAQGLCCMVPEQYRDKAAAVRLWVHECERVLCDRLVSDADIAKFGDLRVNTTKRYFDDVQLVCCSRDLAYLLCWIWLLQLTCVACTAGSRRGTAAAVLQLHGSGCGGPAGACSCARP